MEAPSRQLSPLALVAMLALLAACAAAPPALEGAAQLQSAPDFGRHTAAAVEDVGETTRITGMRRMDAELAAHDAADVARLAAISSQAQAADLRREIAALQTRITTRGLVLTLLGDVLFASGHADLLADPGGNLGQLVAFLGRYPERRVSIEGYTDSVGGEGYNRALSLRRAEAVKSYLVGRGIDPARITASGMGEANPIASDDSPNGRQQNRRVELIIEGPLAASTH